MADGLAWDDLAPELEVPGVGIARMDADGLAMCLIRLDAGLRTDPLFAGLPNDQCQCAHWDTHQRHDACARPGRRARLRGRRDPLLELWSQPLGGHRRGVPRDHPLRGLRRTHGALQARHVGLIAARHRREPVQGRTSTTPRYGPARASSGTAIAAGRSVTGVQLSDNHLAQQYTSTDVTAP